MSKLFDMDNPIWRFMGRLADLFLLTILWLLCSLPIVTMGASTTALYYVTLKMAEGTEGYLRKSFFRSFRENFRLSTVVWLILLAFGAFLGVDLYCYYHLETKAAMVIFWVFLVLAVLYALILTVIFPLAARLDVGVGKLFFMAFMVSLKNFSWVFLMAVVTACLTAVGLFVFWPLLLLLAGGCAYIHSWILVKVIFPKYGWVQK